MDGTFTVDSTLFSQRTRTMLREIGKSEPDFLDEQMGLLSRDVAKFTPPFGGGQLPSFGRGTVGTGKDKKAGEIAVRRDVRNSMQPVAPASKWRQPRIKEAVKNKDTAALTAMFANAEGSAYQGFTVSEFDSKFHSRARDSRGRVNRQQKRLVLPKAAFDAYLKGVLKLVGQGKAHFAWVALQFGQKQPPKWVSRHFWRYRARITKTADSRSATASHGSFVHTLRFLPRIEQVRAANAEKRLLYLTKKAAKTSGLKVA